MVNPMVTLPSNIQFAQYWLSAASDLNSGALTKDGPKASWSNTRERRINNAKPNTGPATARMMFEIKPDRLVVPLWAEVRLPVPKKAGIRPDMPPGAASQCTAPRTRTEIAGPASTTADSVIHPSPAIRYQPPARPNHSRSKSPLGE